MKFGFGLLATAILLLSPTSHSAAEGAAPSADATPAPGGEASSPVGDAAQARELTPEEKAEKEARKECKKKICDIIATRDPEGEDIACDIVKTWREEDIVKMLGGRINWPWGKAVCQSRLELKRRPLALAKRRPIRDRHARAESALHLGAKGRGRALRDRD